MMRTSPTRSRFLLLALILGLGLLSGPARLSAELEEVPAYKFLPLSPANVKAFLARIQEELQGTRTFLAKKYGDDLAKINGNPTLVAYLEVLKLGQAVQAKLTQSGTSKDVELAFIRAQRLHYGILADSDDDTHESKVKKGFQFAINLLGGPLLLNVPNVYFPPRKLGERLAKLECPRLYRPGKPETPVTLEELAEMTAVDISRLQPSPNHTAVTGLPVGDRYQAFLKEQTELIRAQGGKLKSFDLQYAQRILYFDELKDEATSPKITTKDRYGQKWKVKWGDEVHTDVALTRIYIDLGATFSDLKFYSGPGETLVILDPPAKKGPGSIHTWADLSAALLTSRFKFHADRYLLPKPVLTGPDGKALGTGQVDQAMIERDSLDPKYLGAYFVKFKEAQLSLYNPAVKRLGGASLGNVGAIESRVARGSLILNAWIKNKDMKDDNSRVALVFNPKTGGFDRLVEYQSDLGCTMGSLRSSGELNSFDKSFINYMTTTINFKLRPLYVPKAWKACTWADARWMALRIAALSRADLERSFADSGWPSFAQKVAVERLLARRNELVEAFRLGEDGFKPIKCDPDFDFSVKTPHGTDTPVRKGNIVENSPLVKELEETLHPEGLAKVISRKND